MKDIENLSEWARAELINGKLYMLSAPNRLHQYFVKGLVFEIESFIRKNKGKCHVYASPFDVRLFGDASTIVQPDILVVCNRDILTEKGCSGAPDWVIEIVSPSSRTMDYYRKAGKYAEAGVREYWIVDPEKNPALIEESKRILDLAKDLETDVVTTHIGVVPEDNSLVAAVQTVLGFETPMIMLFSFVISIL